MSSNEAVGKVRRTQVSLASVVVATALAWGAAVWLSIRLLIGFAQWNFDPGPVADGLLPHVALAVALATAGVLLWRGRFAWRRERTALWIEERAPELRYALVTLVDPSCASMPERAQLESMVARIRTGPFLRRALAHSLVPAVIALAVSGAVFAAAPSEWRGGLQDRHRLSSVDPDGKPLAEMPSRIGSVTARVTPPAYTKLPSQKLTDPLKISGVVGTRVAVSGRGSVEGITATLGEKGLDVRGRAEGWAAQFSLPEKAVAFTLVDRQYKRVIVIDPQPDLPPDVRLVQPGMDATLRAPTGSLRLEARITDDFGIARARIEYIVSSGEGEGNITSRTGELGARLLHGDKAGHLSLTVPYSHFKLQEGDVLSVSAVAYDANDITGPGKGRSETRNIRIARASEYDTLAITPAPPAFDKTAMSLRMLIIAAEKLVRERPRLKREAFVDRSLKLGHQAEGIRQKLQAIIDEQRGTDAGGAAAFAADPKLMDAMNNMWDGVRALNVAEPGEALPPLRRAYRILRELSNAAKYYLRGTTPPVIVNVERVRLTGEEPVQATARKPRTEADTSRDKLMADYGRAVELLRTDRGRALELFMTMQVTALRESPASAEALGRAIAAIHAGDDMKASLLESRRAIEGASRTVNALPAWSNSW